MFRRLFGRRGSEPVSSAQPEPDAGGPGRSEGGEAASAGPIHRRPTGPAIDACIDILRTGGWRRPLESAIDAMSGDVRQDLYRRIRATLKIVDGAVHVGTTGRDFERYCGRIMEALAEAGFSVEASERCRRCSRLACAGTK
jgi:hypothetical protein